LKLFQDIISFLAKPVNKFFVLFSISGNNFYFSLPLLLKSWFKEVTEEIEIKKKKREREKEERNLEGAVCFVYFILTKHSFTLDGQKVVCLLL